MKHARALALRFSAMFVVVICCAAPTPGDVGGCGQKRQDLDEGIFFATKNAIECNRCQECGITTERCGAACRDDAEGRRFPENCVPLVHDGEVCLRRLLDVDCDTFEDYVDDETALVPSECDFCPGEDGP